MAGAPGVPGGAMVAPRPPPGARLILGMPGMAGTPGAGGGGSTFGAGGGSTSLVGSPAVIQFRRVSPNDWNSGASGNFTARSS